jgi:transketolase
MGLAMREAWGRALVDQGKKHSKLVVLDADVSGSTKSCFFQDEFPNRFFNCGVAEANMVGTAAGFAASGLRPVVNAFAIFLTLKGTDQIRNAVAYNNLPVIIAGAYGGLSDSFDGASHQSITDIAIMRAIPNLQVIVPSDSKQAVEALEYALQQDGPVYVRLNRNEMPALNVEKSIIDTKAVKLSDGKDITIAANGITASFAQEAAKELEAKGYGVDLFSVPFVKPLDSKSLIESVNKTGRLITIEEHNVIGGFASAVSEAFMNNGVSCKFKAIGINDRFTETGPYNELLAKYGISKENIVIESEKLLKQGAK